MDNAKKYTTKLDVRATLQALEPGQSVTFTIAGPDRETSYSSLNSTRRDLHQPDLTVATHDDGMMATVTRKAEQ